MANCPKCEKNDKITLTNSGAFSNKYQCSRCSHEFNITNKVTVNLARAAVAVATGGAIMM